MSILYFIPNATGGGITAEQVASLGLAHAIDPEHASVRSLTRGPDGRSGLLVQRSEGTPVKYDAAAQTWRQFGAYWAGYESRPTPEQLRRKTFLGGPSVVLEDGHHWQVPVARPVASPPSLPQVLGMDERGELTATPSPRYAEAVALADRVFGWFTDESSEATIRDLFSAATAILGVNYRIGDAEASLLGLLTDQNIVLVCQEYIDWPAMLAVGRELRDAEKKSVSVETPVG